MVEIGKQGLYARRVELSRLRVYRSRLPTVFRNSMSPLLRVRKALLLETPVETFRSPIDDERFRRCRGIRQAAHALPAVSQPNRTGVVEPFHARSIRVRAARRERYASSAITSAAFSLIM